MSEMIKKSSVIFFDIDGTLVAEDANGTIPESTREAIAETRRRGNLTFINTGRTAFNVSSRIRELGFDGYICGCGTYVEYGGRVISENRLDQDFCRKIADIMKECRVVPVYEDRDGYFFDEETFSSEILKNFLEVFIEPDIDIRGRIEDDNFIFDKFVVWMDEKTDVEKYRSVVGKYFDIIDRGGGLYENVPLGFSKATGIRCILDKLGIPLENAYVIGDSMNDLPMFKAVPNSIAMGGAEQVYPYVSYITTPLEDDGIANALRHFGLIAPQTKSCH